MAEWGSFFKNAVANVEQRLDKVLLEERPRREPRESAPPSPQPASGPLVATHFEVVPDLHPVVHKAQKLALAVHSDAALEVLDMLETAAADVDRYVDAASERLLAAQGKLQVLARERTAAGEDQQQIVQLVDEGRALAQQELKLNLLVKKLRAEKQAAVAKQAAVSSRANEAEQLRAQLASLEERNSELEALAEHYRQMPPDAAPVKSNAELEQQLDTERARLAEERAEWRAVEAGLLARVAELEQLAAARSQASAELQTLLGHAQQSLATAQSENAGKTAELAMARADAADADALRTRLGELEAELAVARAAGANEYAEELAQELAGASTPRAAPAGPSSNTAAASAAPHAFSALAPSLPLELAQDDSGAGELAVSDDSDSPGMLQSPHSARVPRLPQTPPLTRSLALQDMDEPLPEPISPFCQGNDSALSLESMRHYSQDSLETLESLDAQRRFSEGEPDAPPLRIVNQLSLKIRRLESQLANAKRLAQLHHEQNEAAQAELARLMDADEQLEVLQRRFDELLAANEQLRLQVEQLHVQDARKQEVIAELEADVEDVKDAYKQQILDLVAEIETLRSN